ncbi:LON peptidase substrate-binding domain-containing protein [Angustibacter aerolatus]
MSQTLPLFPLGTTLLPGQVLPLHVFEQRYRDLVDALVPGGGDRVPRGAGPGGRGPCFGVVAIRRGHEVGSEQVHALHRVGCVAEVLQLRRHGDGSSDLVAVGRERFHLLGLDESAGTSYLTGRVEPLPEPVGTADVELVERVRGLLGRYADRVGTTVRETSSPRRADGADGADGADETEGVEGADGRERVGVEGSSALHDATLLSWVVAGAVLLHPGERQSLLEAPDAATRLRAARTMLRRELLLLDLAPSVPATDLVREPPDPR